jgi:hypothetical protein
LCYPSNQVVMMILRISVSIKEILEQGLDFKWPRPKRCPSCHHCRLWGHGFVLAYFDGLSEGIWLRRWRCPMCGGVHRMKPEGYFRRFQASAAKIRRCLCRRLITGFWPKGVSRSRQGHWLRSLKRNVAAYLGLSYLDRFMEGFDRLVKMGRIPVGRFI